jgi:hypothetical protein
MRFSLDVLRAHKGDCLMLHFGSPDEPRLMVIDGGPADVYKPELKPRLQRLRAKRADLDDADPLPIDVVMVSHVDDDHIRGIIELTEEQRRKTSDLRLAVTSLWHNSFDDLLTTKPSELVAGSGAASITTAAAESFDSGSVLASIGQKKLNDDTQIEDEDMRQTIEVLASIPQGRTLRDNASELGWKPNRQFKGKLILAKAGAQPVTLDGGVKITVAGPMQPELMALQQEHDDWLRKQTEKKKSAPEAELAAFVDESIPNLSSIVMFAEAAGKSMLLTGDARGDKILEGLELAGILAAGGTRHVDLLKVPHHGSDNNMETVFFKRLPADHYVFSGDGQHGNPERATMQMLLEARGVGDDYTIHLTYPVAEIDEGRKADWEKEQAKQVARKKKNPKTEVREDWSPAKHSLTAFFEDNPKFAMKIKIVQEKQSHMIDLLDPVKI